LHGLERAIERAELRPSASAPEVHLWMRPAHLGKVAVRLVERAGVVEVAVRAETPAARGWLAEGLPALLDDLRARGFGIQEAGRPGETGIDWWAQQRPDARREPGRREPSRRRSGRTVFSMQTGESS
jgi:hypothetical protein